MSTDVYSVSSCKLSQEFMWKINDILQSRLNHSSLENHPALKYPNKAQ